MDTKIESVEQSDGKFVVEVRLRIAPGDVAGFHHTMNLIALALFDSMAAPEQATETTPAGTQSVLEDEIAGLRREALEFKQAYDKAIEEIASLTFEKQRLQAQLIGLAR